MSAANDLYDLEKLVKKSFRNVPLAPISHWKIGGNADLLVRPCTVTELMRLRETLYARGIGCLVIGATSNLLFDDDGLRVPCIQIGNDLAQVSFSGPRVTAQAGVWVPGFARMLMKHQLTGGEHICGIPGTLGGLVCMNGGSQRKGIGDNIVSVTTVDEQGQLRKRNQAECEFSYRKSVFQRLNEIIVEIEFEFNYSDSQTRVRRDMLDILKSRRLKFPRKEPNCGSVFKSNPAMYAEVGPPGQIIEKLGFKGYRYKSVMVSPLHANFITHDGKGEATHIKELIELIHSTVLKQTGFSMEVEVQFLNTLGSHIN